jgi:hypothetical protein
MSYAASLRCNLFSTAPYFVCRAEWFDGRLRKEGLEPALALPDRIVGTDITVDWSPVMP